MLLSYIIVALVIIAADIVFALIMIEIETIIMFFFDRFNKKN